VPRAAGRAAEDVAGAQRQALVAEGYAALPGGMTVTLQPSCSAPMASGARLQA
jgi:hypothetical protein